MDLTSADCEKTLLDVFAQRALSSSEEMPLVEVEALWDATTLRRRDLLVALSGLCANGLITIEECPNQGAALSLTGPGEQRIQALRTAGPDAWGRHLRESLLPRIRTIDLPAETQSGRRGYEIETPDILVND